ncbi:MAG: phosphatase PAP2 family protein [Alphaproteobacteria bacterium]|nr:phosphatase PAP2 family protein [Alphaproteobacteria bacterium]
MFLTKENKIKWKFLGAALVAVVLLCLAGILWLDKHIFIFLREFDGLWVRIFQFAGSSKFWLFASITVFGIAGFLYIMFSKFWIGFSNKARLLSRISVFVFISVLLSGAATGVLKFVFGRMRPILWEVFGQTGFYPLNAEWVLNSFPSGHATASFAGLVMIGLWFPRLKWATWTLAVMAGLSRISLGAHWPSDVLLGAFIGMVTADFVFSIFKRSRRMDFFAN